jgi:REP element-mobilizing transposase RayT
MADEEWRRFTRARHTKFDVQLDGGRWGPKHLADSRIACLVVDALLFHQTSRYNLSAYVVMPNHVHLVIRPQAKEKREAVWGLDEIMKNLKSYTGRKANEILGLSGEFWQREYYDHLIRDEEEWRWYVDYTHLNPVRAGLCLRAEDWDWSSARAASARE